MIWIGIVGGVYLSWVVFGYPLMVKRAARGLDLPPLAAAAEDFTIVLIVRDAADWIGGKLDRLTALDHPSLRCILIVDDGSTDDTVSLAGRVTDERIRLLETPRLGKSAALNTARQVLETPVALLVDVRQELSAESVDRLVRRVSAPSPLGACSGRLVPAGGSVAHWSREADLRIDEGRLGRTIGLSGCAAAIRRSHWVFLPDDCLVDDMALGLGVLATGGLVALDPDVPVSDPLTPTVREELHRKVRTLAGNWQILCDGRRYRLPTDPDLEAALWSHKLLRLLLPLGTLAVLIGFGFGGESMRALGTAVAIVVGLTFPARLIEFFRLNFAALVAAFRWRALAGQRGWGRAQGLGSK